MIRYYPNGEESHYTAKVLVQGVLQIKSPSGDRKMFSTVEKWLSTLPGFPDLSMLHITTKDDEEQRIKRKKKQVDKNKLSWHVPSMESMRGPLPWARRIYNLIREHHYVCKSGLLQCKEICFAYNRLVDVLTNYSNHMRIRNANIYIKYYRYENIFEISDLKTHIVPLSDMSLDHLIEIVIEVYRPLYDMLCNSVVPYVKQILKKRQQKHIVDSLKKYRNKYVRKMMKLTSKYERESTHIRNQMEYYQDRLNRAELE